MMYFALCLENKPLYVDISFLSNWQFIPLYRYHREVCSLQLHFLDTSDLHEHVPDNQVLVVNLYNYSFGILLTLYPIML